MNEINENSPIGKKIRKKFYGHDTLKSKYLPQIPQSAEREYIRIVNEYMRLLKVEVEKYLPDLKKSYKSNRDTLVQEQRRLDSSTDLILKINDVFTRIKSQIISKTAGFGLRKKFEVLSKLNRKLTVKEWKKALKVTLGIDIREDYYLGEFYLEQLQVWVAQNISLISTIPEDTLDKMKDIVYDGYTKGKTTTSMVKDIQRIYRVGLKHATLIARDQTAKLNGQIQRYQQMDAGITEYIWSTSQDERVRESHRALDGQKFSWDSPPLNSDGRECHPGEDYQCRCIGRPVFNRSTLNLPIDDSVEVSIK
mgnify:CR=1 FL=1|jgi:hypothetical protein